MNDKSGQLEFDLLLTPEVRFFPDLTEHQEKRRHCGSGEWGSQRERERGGEMKFSQKIRTKQEAPSLGLTAQNPTPKFPMLLCVAVNKLPHC